MHVCSVSRRATPPFPMLTSHRSFRFPELMKFFNARRASYHTNPRIIDDVIYTPYIYEPSAPNSQRHVHFQSQHFSSESEANPPPATGDLLGVAELAPIDATSHSHDEATYATNKSRKKSKFQEVPTQAEIFLFQYGTIVIWGMTEPQEKRFLSSMCVSFVRSFPRVLT